MISRDVNGSIQPSSLTAPTNTASVRPGKLRIEILSCFLNIPVKKPYVVITLGDQQYHTSISEDAEGRWNESFELSVSFHAQLFDTIQLDIYDHFMVLSDKHVGRCEIRLSTLQHMPESYVSYYEVWEKKLCVGGSSNVPGKRTRITNCGALQAKITYRYRNAEKAPAAIRETNEENHQPRRLADLPKPKSNELKSTNLVNEQQLAEEFKRHLRFQRERRSTSSRFQKFEEEYRKAKEPLADTMDYPDDSDTEDEQDDDDVRPLTLTKQSAKANYDQSQRNKVTHPPEMKDAKERPKNRKFGSIFQGSKSSSMNTSRSVTQSPKLEAHEIDPLGTSNETVMNTLTTLSDDDQTLKAYPVLKAIGAWTMNKETNQVLHTVGKLLAAFGQGFELTNMQVLVGFNVLQKFYQEIPRERTWDVVEELSEIDLAAYFWKFSVASYGWKGLNFIGQGNGYITDAVRSHSDALSIIQYLSIPKDDLLAYEFRTAEAFRPSYFIAHDRHTNAIVLSIRGTMSVFDTLTDLVCEYEPWRGGLVHKGMKSSALWFFRHVAPQLVVYCNEHGASALYILGHSLGAGTAAILTIMLLDYVNEFRNDTTEEFTLRSFGYAPACAMSLDLATKYKDHIQSIVFGDDIVSKLSYGSMMDLKDLIMASADAAQQLKIGQLLWAGKTQKDRWDAAFDRIREVRRRCLDTLSNPKLYVAGSIYQFWLDPTANNPTRIVVEKTEATRVSSEIILRKSIIFDHLPTNFDLAFRRAREALMVEGALGKSDQRKPSGVLDKPSSQREEEQYIDPRLQKPYNDDSNDPNNDHSNISTTALWDAIAGLRPTNRQDNSMKHP
ncbi:uncharacterized protein BYT42DRAFT_550699 [Radiomyces spectabilis]|uniref:uncharacterized protein n=1 Tax=Radiomyces spectabilis TaxID=64574 RepID=UPI00221EBC79|nr:uncharacterized protein BYT42DRAFT_550699 [Radiomyces spectabilis]KAI8393336.1 hypothetical protein BYT42DRAFT_550699 [Radiomyces spectabilis]